jgi:hypothetical protein
MNLYQRKRHKSYSFLLRKKSNTKPANIQQKKKKKKLSAAVTGTPAESAIRSTEVAEKMPQQHGDADPSESDAVPRKTSVSGMADCPKFHVDCAKQI